MLNPLDLDYLITLDFETYYDSEYNLRRLTYIEYIQDPRFNIHGAAIQINDSDPIWYHTKGQLKQAIQEIPWNKAGLIGHNLHFDGLVLQKKYDILPQWYIDTLGLSRSLLPTLEKHSLEFIAKFLNLGVKDQSALRAISGVMKLDPQQLRLLSEYCLADVKLTYEIYNALVKYYPIEEFELMDLTIRMQTQPQFILDREGLVKVIQNEKQKQEDALDKANTNITTIRSSAKLAEEFRNRGIEPPTKISPRTHKSTFAFAKTDPGMIALKNHSDPNISSLAKARLKCMSSLNSKRAKRFVAIHDCNDGYLPVTLNYYAAHTGRWGGTDKTNMQNLTKKSGLRNCLLAPSGHVVLAADQSQIEARLTAWLADHLELLDDFKRNDEGIGYDVYVIMASHIYNRSVEKITEDQRFIGKMCVLGLGYGMGVDKLFAVLTNILGEGKIDYDEVQHMVETYRRINRPIVNLWKELDHVISEMANGRSGTFKCLSFEGTSIQLPSGMFLQYPYLTAQETQFGVGYAYDYKGNSQYIYGGRLTENIVQALARTVIADNMRKIQKEYPIATMTHDEIVIIPPKSVYNDAEKFMIDVMTTPPSWAPTIPLNIEVKVDECYSKD